MTFSSHSPMTSLRISGFKSSKDVISSGVFIFVALAKKAVVYRLTLRLVCTDGAVGLFSVFKIGSCVTIQGSVSRSI